MADSLEQVLGAHSALRALARGLLSDAHLAEDVLQDVAVSELQAGAEPGVGTGYLRRVVSNRARNVRRARLRAARHAQALPARSGVPTAVEMAEREEARQRVARAVLALSDPYRTAVWLRFFEDLPPRKIARRMDTPVNTVRTWLRRALSRLRENLDREHGGDRAAWCVLLAPLTQRATFSAASVLLTLSGILLMKKSLALALVLVVAVWVASGGGLWPAGSDLPPSAGELQTQLALGEVVGDRVEDLQRTELAALSTQSNREPRVVVAAAPSGSLEYSNGAPAVGVDYWVWHEQRPGWTLSRVEAGYSPGARQLGPPHGKTDTEGGWAAPEHIERIRAVSFRISSTVVVSFALDLGETCVLPATDEIRSWLQGARVEDEWKILYTPAVVEIRDNQLEYNCAVHMVYPVETRSGSAMVSVLQTTLEGKGSAPVVLVGVVGLPYQLVVDGTGFAVDPPYTHIAAPAATQHKVVTRRPTLAIEVVDDADNVVALAGLASCGQLDASGVDHDKLVAGRARLTYERGEPGDYRTTVLTSEGELFERDFDALQVGDSPMRFVHGQGIKPVLVSLGRPVNVDQIVGLFLHGPDGTVHAGLSDWLLHFGSGAALGSLDAETLWLQDRGQSWLSGHLVLRDGRVARLGRSLQRRAAHVQVDWLPVVDLAPVVLGDLEHAERGLIRLRIALPQPSGASTWVALQSFQYGPLTSPWPTWELVAPRGFARELRHYRIDQSELVFDLPVAR